MSDPGWKDWKDELPTPPQGGRLIETWFTTYDHPDAGLLVEDLLPSLLGMEYSLTQEVKGRNCFFVELNNKLQYCHDKITIVSSPFSKSENPQYPWLWRYVNHFTVGAKSRAVQHAKLWAFHWEVDGKEHLELHVSSTNLTYSAFRNQVQAGWQVSLPLGKQATKKMRAKWEELVTFLNALGASAGEKAKERIDRLVGLLGRAGCPDGVMFVASIPGHKSTARQLRRQFAPSELHVLTPTIGEWNEETLKVWSKEVGIPPGKIHLKWIDGKHPWAGTGWTLSATACEAMGKAGVKIERIPDDARLSNEHRKEIGNNGGVLRWPHSKLYLMSCAKGNKLLVTSANWSPSAWGARNFELGVVIETKWNHIDDKEMFKPFTNGTAPFCCIEKRSTLDDPKLQWAEANWDGKCILLCARSSDPGTPVTVSIAFSDGKKEVGDVPLKKGSVTVPWQDVRRTPLTARFKQGTEMLEVNVLDLRSLAEFAKTPLPEVDPNSAAALREAFLVQHYGGPVVDSDFVSGLNGAGKTLGASAPATDYTVQAWLDARAGFEIVDNWQAALTKAREKAESALFERIRLDGEELLAIYKRREGSAAGLVAEELGWRIKEEA